MIFPVPPMRDLLNREDIAEVGQSWGRIPGEDGRGVPGKRWDQSKLKAMWICVRHRHRANGEFRQLRDGFKKGFVGEPTEFRKVDNKQQAEQKFPISRIPPTVHCVIFDVHDVPLSFVPFPPPFVPFGVPSFDNLHLSPIFIVLRGTLVVPDLVFVLAFGTLQIHNGRGRGTRR